MRYWTFFYSMKYLISYCRLLCLWHGKWISSV